MHLLSDKEEQLSENLGEASTVKTKSAAGGERLIKMRGGFVFYARCQLNSLHINA